MLVEIDRFHKWLRRKYPRTSTPLHYTSDLVLFFDWAAKPPSAITPADVDAFIEHSQTAGHCVATVNRRLAALSVFYRFLDLEADDAPPNPVIARRHFIRRGRRLPRDAQDPELALLFAVIQRPRDRALFLLMLRCGLRVGEVRNLSLGDLYLDPAPGALPRVWVSGKGDAQRIVYLSAQMRAVLREWLTARPASADPAVFLNRFGGRFTVTGIQLLLASYCHQAGVWITCHQFRHTFARHMTEAHMPVTSLQRLLGHARLRSTQVYLHISDTQIQADYEAAIARVAERLAPSFPTGGVA